MQKPIILVKTLVVAVTEASAAAMADGNKIFTTFQ